MITGDNNYWQLIHFHPNNAHAYNIILDNTGQYIDWLKLYTMFVLINVSYFLNLHIFSIMIR